MAELKALIFDVDGTLAETERDGHRPAFNQAFVDAGLDWHWSTERYGELLEVSGGKERIRAFIESKPDFVLPEGFADLTEFVRSLHATKTKYYTQYAIEGRIPLRPGVERLLSEAREKGVRLAIATTTTPANVQALLASTLGTESLDWFEVIAAGDMVPHKKPAPDVFEYAISHLNLPAENCLAFEDTNNGLLSATQTGLKTIVTVNDYTHTQDFSKAALVISDLGEPDEPFKVVFGEVGDAQYLDIALARKICEA
ncbi:haloacid dehalogenase-like hydrolase, putative [Synechococcus sp. PCC 7335]|uniref:HAD-IA family hydrolase n=1 Tax=Synechococcus sp. (strain ATCC 29403 / PCC 7335) TaxID=91464 RepID=UPI00017EC405|nr:HAD-IA family hydrolase [Synechococcus sp. PCC 7335]EDX86929.1 haloacid dehalogenase-like hydrolase, putative [Synechococcus sp. PCC 7335]